LGVEVRVHAIEAGRLVGNKTFMRGEGWSMVWRRREDYEFPVYVYVVEQPDGLLAIDTGMSARGWPAPGPIRRFIPSAASESKEEEIGPRMRAEGLRPEDVRTVLFTHLDPDHVGGIAHFPNAEFLVNRREHEFASTFMGKLRQRPQDWHPGFAPTLYDLEPEPYGPFPESKSIGDDAQIRVVPLPGHSIGQVGVIMQTNGAVLFFVADHMLRQDWFLEDYGAGRLGNLGIVARKHYAQTQQRIHRFLEDVPSILLPAHDTEAPARLGSMEPHKV
jgi:glyoxylase-like metal-dependent hydrolase (beta-lactamase superfamily II)